VVVTNEIGCSGRLDDGLAVTSTLSDALLSAVAPAFRIASKETAVTLTGSGFMTLPRVYISPANSTPTPFALRAVELKSATQLTAVVPVASRRRVRPDRRQPEWPGGPAQGRPDRHRRRAADDHQRDPGSLPAKRFEPACHDRGLGFKAGLRSSSTARPPAARAPPSPPAGRPAAGGKSVVTNVTMSNAMPSAPTPAGVPGAVSQRRRRLLRVHRRSR
jgi:hypothetical protein